MSVLSALALFLTTGAAVANRRAGGQDDKRVAELEARVAELEDAIATANAHARRDQELIDLWRERALAPIPGPPAGFGPPVPQLALQQSSAAMRALQGQAQAARQPDWLQARQGQQQAQMPAHYQEGLAQQNQALAQSMGGAQMIDAELYCNCVPSRSQVWAANG